MTKYPLILNEVFHFVCLNLNEDSSPLLTSGSVLSLLKYRLWGMPAKLGASSWVPNAQGQLGNTQAVFHNLYSHSASQGPEAEWGGRCPCLWHGSTGGAVQCLRCSSSILDALRCVGWRFWFFHVQVEAVNVKHPICMLMRFLCIFNIWNSLIFSNISVCWSPISATDC